MVIEQRERDLAAGLVDRGAEEQGARQRDRHERVADAARRGQLDEVGQPGAPRPGGPRHPLDHAARAAAGGRPGPRAGLGGGGHPPRRPPGFGRLPAHPMIPSILRFRSRHESAGQMDVTRSGPDRDVSMHADGGELLNVSPTRTRTREPDEVCAQAVDLARTAAEETAAPSTVGDHLGVEADGERVVTHLFALPRPRLPWLAMGGHGGPGVAVQDRHRGREPARCPARTPSWPRRGFPGGSGSGPATWGRETFCLPRSMTSGSRPPRWLRATAAAWKT